MIPIHLQIIHNLGVIDSQKQVWAAENRKNNYAAPSEADLAPYFSNGKFPKTLVGEIYVINSIAQKPTAMILSRLKIDKMTVEAGSTITIPDK